MNKCKISFGNSLTLGFTLLELLVVLVIVGLLAAFVGPRYLSHLGKSEHTVARAQVSAIARALSTYRIDVGNFPTNEEGLQALRIKPANANKWNGPYMQDAIPPDPWGRQYIYKTPGRSGDFEVGSLGKDGVAGGENENADIYN